MSFPGARAPERRRRVDANGLGIASYEWGEEAAPPLLLVHGGFDFARTFDVFAPLLAAGGFRVVSYDQRGHGDSDHAGLYSWEADLRDLLAVLDATSAEPLPIVGHSKGGGLATSLAHALPERFTHLVNLEGLPSTQPTPDVADREHVALVGKTVVSWLDHRRSTAGRVRRAGSLDELARRRARMNPRLSHAWLHYLASLGARRDPDGYRWKLDPVMRFGGFGPWRPGWSLEQLHRLRVPLLGAVALVHEALAPVVDAGEIRSYLPPRARLETFADTGHFLHIERPAEVAALTLDFLR